MEHGLLQCLVSLVLSASSVEGHDRPDCVFWFQNSMTEHFQAALLSEKTRRQAGHTTYGSSQPSRRPSSLSPSALSRLVSLTGRGIQVLRFLYVFEDIKKGQKALLLGDLRETASLVNQRYLSQLLFW